MDLGLGDLRHQSGPFAALHFCGSLALGFRGKVRREKMATKKRVIQQSPPPKRNMSPKKELYFFIGNAPSNFQPLILREHVSFQGSTHLRSGPMPFLDAVGH